MPRCPNLSATAEAIPASIFARLVERVMSFDGEVIPFHIGDTHLAPPTAARLGSLGFTPDNEPEIYRYSKAHGDLGLLDAIVIKLRERNGLSWVTEANVQITSGATHALSCAVRATLDPGDHMLVLAPYWPLIRGISLSAGVTPIDVACPRATIAHESIGELIEGFVGPKTAGLYLSNPNNPDGKLYTSEQLREIAEVARRHDLWVVADEVYEDFVFDGLRHETFAGVEDMRDHTMTAYSFSKSFGLAGLRVGYLVGPTEAMAAARRMVGHTIYSVPRAMQRAAHAALTRGDEFLAQARQDYQDARDFALEHLEAPCAKPSACTYLFLDLRKWISGEQDSAIEVLEKIAEAGVLLAPGAAFGQDFAGYARLCFTSVPRSVLEEGIERVNRVLARLKTH